MFLQPATYCKLNGFISMCKTTQYMDLWLVHYRSSHSFSGHVPEVKDEERGEI
jgi:hypothetical protein